MKLTIDPQVCINCKECIAICPMDAIKDVFGYAEIDEDRCVRCRMCLTVCPVDAIKVRLH